MPSITASAACSAASIAAEVVSGDDIAAVRLAVARLFTSFELHDVTGFANPPRSGPTHVLAEGEGVTYWILPRVRADALAGVNQLVDGLKPVPLTLTAEPAGQPAPTG